MRRLLLVPVLAAISVILSSSLFAVSREEMFFKANEAYRNENYSEAERQYKILADEKNPSGHVLFNLGNSYYRLGYIGNAVLYYEKAAKKIPRDADLNYNLSYARGKCRDALEPMPKPLGGIYFWIDSFSLAELFWLFAAVNLAFFVSLAVRVYIRREWTFTLVIVVLLVWLGAGSSFGAKFYQDMADSRAVVTSQEAGVMSGPDPGDINLFKLHAGAILRAEKTDSGWSLIRISDGRRGWVNNNSIGFISK